MTARKHDWFEKKADSIAFACVPTEDLDRYRPIIRAALRAASRRGAKAALKEQRLAIAQAIRERGPEAKCCVECALKHAADIAEKFEGTT